MKQLIIILLLFIGSHDKTFPQKLTFAYDSAGNQIERLWSSSSSSPLAGLKQSEKEKDKSPQLPPYRLLTLRDDSTFQRPYFKRIYYTDFRQQATIPPIFRIHHKNASGVDERR